MIGARVPVSVVTGFLGAGKTTLLRHLVERARGRRLALVINEFGELGVDREWLLGCGVAGCGGDDIVELANGCICCTVADDFQPAMAKLLARERAPEHIVIETSGLALPKPLVQAFAWPELRARASVDGVIAMVDAPSFAAGRFAGAPGGAHERPLAELFDDQIACADLIVLNKLDLVDDGERARLMADLAARKRPGARLIGAVRGAVDPRVALGLGAAAEDDLASRPSHADGEGEHDHDDFESFVVARAPIANPASFVARLRAVAGAHDVLRIKGFLAVEAKPMRLAVQGVGQRLDAAYDRPWRADEERASRLVVIGEKGLDRARIEAALAA